MDLLDHMHLPDLSGCTRWSSWNFWAFWTFWTLGACRTRVGMGEGVGWTFWAFRTLWTFWAF